MMGSGRFNAPLAGQRILVIEDEFTVADLMCELLAAEGAVVSGPIGRLQEALDFVAASGEAFDLAVLDVDLHGEKTYPVADMLDGFGIPFVFVSGYGSEMFEDRYRAHRRCEKPFRRSELIEALTLPFD